MSKTAESTTEGKSYSSAFHTHLLLLSLLLNIDRYLLLNFLDQCVDKHLCQWLPEEECQTEIAKQDCPKKCGKCEKGM